MRTLKMHAHLHKTHRTITRNHDTILILGDGQSMPADLKKFLQWNIPHDVGALGRAVREYPGTVDHWFNADGDLSIAWARDLPAETIKHTMGEVDAFDTDWDLEQPDYHNGTITNEGPGSRMHGSSALFATLACIEMGYQKIILAGCPLDTEGHYYFPQNKETLGPIWLGYDYMAWLDFAEQPEAKRVASMSGYTAKILGTAK
jgi:hypothetical protein